MTASIAIIGAGTIGQHHARAAVESQIDVKYVVDVDVERATELAATCGATPTSDLLDVLSDANVAGVIVAIPNSFHRPVAIQALEAEKDVLLEKPMGMNASECEAINAAAQQNERFVQVGLVRRYSSVGQSAKQFVDDGRLGQIYHAKAMLYRRRGVPGLGGWFTNKSLSGGGAIIDIGVHVIDLAMHLMGFPKVQQVLGRVYNNFGSRMQDYVYEDMWAGPPNYHGICDVDDAAHALVLFENGATLDLNATWAGNFPTGSLPESMIGLFGQQGGMTFELDGDHLLLAEEEGRHNVDKRVMLAPKNSFVDQLTDFVQSIETREVRGATGAEATEVQRIIDAVYASSERGEAVSLGS